MFVFPWPWKHRNLHLWVLLLYFNFLSGRLDLSAVISQSFVNWVSHRDPGIPSRKHQRIALARSSKSRVSDGALGTGLLVGCLPDGPAGWC